MAKNGSGSTIVLGVAALGLLYVLSQRNGASSTFSGGIRLADGSTLMPDGRIVAANGQVLRTLSPTQQMQYRAQLAQRGGLSTMDALRMVKSAIGYAPKVYSFLDKLLSDPPATGGTASVGAGVLRDRAITEMGSDPNGVQAMIEGDPADAWAAIDEFQGNQFVGADGLPVDWADQAGLVDLSADWNAADWSMPDVAPELVDVPVGDAADIPFTTGPISSDAIAGGFEAAESGATMATQPIGAATSTADAGASLTSAISVATVIGAAAVAVSAAFTIAGDLPDDQKAIMVALDVIIFALAFIPVFGWALAIVGALVKSIVGDQMKPRLSHAQREAIELANTLGKVAKLPPSAAHALSPTMLWNAVYPWTSGYYGGWTDVAVLVTYLSPRRGERVYVGEPQMGSVNDVKMGEPQDFINCDPLSIQVSIQAGVDPRKLEMANARIALGLGNIVQRLKAAQLGDVTATRACVHVWHLYRPYAIDVPSLIEPEIDAEMPLLAETIRSLYYQDVARLFGFKRWTELMGMVLQDRWTTYRAQHAAPQWNDFAASLGVTDVRQLRAWCFEGRFGFGTEDPAMFTQVFNKLQDLQFQVAYLAGRDIRDAPIIERQRYALWQQGLVSQSAAVPAVTIDNYPDLVQTLEGGDAAGVAIGAPQVANPNLTNYVSI